MVVVSSTLPSQLAHRSHSRSHSDIPSLAQAGIQHPWARWLSEILRPQRASPIETVPGVMRQA